MIENEKLAKFPHFSVSNITLSRQCNGTQVQLQQESPIVKQRESLDTGIVHVHLSVHIAVLC